jgi:hypothetical protein
MLSVLEKGAYLTANGYITPCCMIKEPDTIGKITDIDVGKINEYKQYMKDLFSEGDTPVQCKDCEITSIILDLPGNVFVPVTSLSEKIKTNLAEMRDELLRWSTLLDTSIKLSNIYLSNKIATESELSVK